MIRLKNVFSLIILSTLIALYCLRNSHWYFNHFIKAQEKKTTLMDHFTSFQSPDEVLTIFRNQNIKYELDGDYPSEVALPKRESAEITYIANQFRHLNNYGELKVRFNNKRLYQIFFKPEHLENYIEEINRYYGNDFRSIKKIQINNDIDVYFNDRANNEKFFVWNSVPLLNEVNETDD